MKKLLMSLTIVGLIFVGSNAPGAVTFVFDPDDLIQLYPDSPGGPDNKATQVNARRTHQPWATNVYETFNNVAPYTKPQPDSYNTYMNWRDGLGANEGISGFNIWLQDNPRARSWGESAVWNPLGSAPTGTADAAGLWNVEVIPNPWGTGWLVQWSTDQPANYINSVSDIGEFSFSGTPYWDNNFATSPGYDAADPEVQIGEVARIWFGAANWTEADGAQEWSVHFDDEGWGTRSENDGGPWDAGLVGAEEGYGSGYEGVLGITAIPEPGSLVIWGLLGAGAAGLGVWRRRRRSVTRAPWTEENRQAIREIVDRGRFNA